MKVARVIGHTTAVPIRLADMGEDIPAITIEVETHLSVIPFGDISMSFLGSKTEAFTHLVCSR